MHAVAGDGVLRWTGWRAVLRAPKWVGGLGVVVLGALLHTAALSLAPLVVVQPVGVLAITVTTVLAARSRRTGLGPGIGGPITASTLGVGAFVVLAATSSVERTIPEGADIRAVFAVAAIVVFAGLLGTVTSGRVRCLCYAAAAGASYGLVSVLVHASAVRIEATGLRGIHLATAFALVIALLAGCWFVQRAYAAGPPQVVVACQTLLDPMVAVGVGIGLLGEAGRLGLPTAIGLVTAGVVAVLGVIALSRPAASPDPSTPDVRPLCGEHLRVVVGADTFPPDINGAARFGARLAAGLAAGGHEVHVLCPAATGARRRSSTLL